MEKRQKMGLNVSSLYSYNTQTKSVIDSEALQRVAEQILNPNNEKTVDVSSLDLSKFNRVSLGTDLYSKSTSGEIALQASKSAVDFGVQLSETFAQNVQYLNSQAAQSLFTSKENNGQIAFSIDSVRENSQNEAVAISSQVSETQDMNKDKRGSNPFSFYVKVDEDSENEDSEAKTSSLNIFA